MQVRTQLSGICWMASDVKRERLQIIVVPDCDNLCHRDDCDRSDDFGPDPADHDYRPDRSCDRATDHHHQPRVASPAAEHGSLVAVEVGLSSRAVHLPSKWESIVYRELLPVAVST